VVDSLKVLDLERPIREADSSRTSRQVRFVPAAVIVESEPTVAEESVADVA